MTQTILTIFFWMGGWFAFLYAFAKFFTHLFYPYLAYLSVIVRLFQADPSKASTPRDPLAVERATPADLLLAA